MVFARGPALTAVESASRRAAQFLPCLSASDLPSPETHGDPTMRGSPCVAILALALGACAPTDRPDARAGLGPTAPSFDKNGPHGPLADLVVDSLALAA